MNILHTRITPLRMSDLITAVCAACDGRKNAVQYITDALRTGESPDRMSKRQRTALWYAVRRNRADLVALLCSAGADPNARVAGENYLTHAARLGYVQVCKALVRHGAHIKSYYFEIDSVLHVACYTGQIEVIRWLCDAGANINELNGFLYDTPLTICIAAGNVAAVRVLCEAGANVNQHHEYGPNALYQAVNHDDDVTFQLMIDVLCDAGVDLNYADEYGTILERLLRIIQRVNDPRINRALYLIQHGANLQLVRRENIKPRIFARVERISCLLELRRVAWHVSAALHGSRLMERGVWRIIARYL